MNLIKRSGGTYTGECFCENGDTSRDSACPINGDHFCESCDAGFIKIPRSYEQTPVGSSQLTNEKSYFCGIEECACEDGSGVVGIDCPRISSEERSSCPRKCYFHNLHRPARGSYPECVEYQVFERSDIDKVINGTTALYQAALSGNVDSVRILANNPVNNANLSLGSTEYCTECTRYGMVSEKFLPQIFFAKFSHFLGQNDRIFMNQNYDRPQE